MQNPTSTRNTVACDQPVQNILTRLTEDMLIEFRRSGFWGTETIYARARHHADADPTKIAVSDSYSSLTYGELIELADRIASRLFAAGLRPGDRVAAWLSSRVEVAPLLLACARDGYIFCPSLHRNHTVADIDILLRRMSARAVIVEDGYGADADKHDACAMAARMEHVAEIFRLPPPKARTAQDIGRYFASDAAECPAPSSTADQVVYLAFTSGTTADPKGVMHTNNTLLANARALASDWAFQSSSVLYTISPLSHNLGFGALVLAMHVGASIVLHDLPRQKSLLKRLRETKTTFVFGVPAHAIDLLQEIEEAGTADLGHLTGFRISGAAAPPGIVERLMKHGIMPQSGYGMTEACSHNYTLPNDSPQRIIDTSGRTCPGYELKIFSIDNPDQPLAIGEIGQIGGRGASLMLGYFDNQNATEASFNRDGWFMTGDIGQLDEDGYVRITGRIKEVIIRGGHNIHPAQIEQLAMRHQGVQRAAAVPVKDERLGERVCIVVMPNGRGPVDSDDLLAYLAAEGLSKYDMPEFFLQVDEIPLSANGKVLKRALMPGIADGTLVPQPVRWRG